MQEIELAGVISGSIELTIRLERTAKISWCWIRGCLQPLKRPVRPPSYLGRQASKFIFYSVVGDRNYLAKAGDFIGYRAGGEPHQLKNNGNSLLKYIVVGQRLEHDVGDYPNLKKRIYRNKRLKWNLVDIKNIEEPVAGKKT